MNGVYWPEGQAISHITVRVNGRYPSSFDSVIQLDSAFAKYSKQNIESYAHEMVHAVDQTLGYSLPGCWLEGRAEYISRKVCDRMKAGYDKYKPKYNWKFLSDKDKADFFRFYLSLSIQKQLILSDIILSNISVNHTVRTSPRRSCRTSPTRSKSMRSTE